MVVLPRRAFAPLVLSVFAVLISASASVACTIGDIRCFCDAAPSGMLAAGRASLLGDVTSPGCASFYDCARLVYSSCPAGDSFSQMNQTCQKKGDCPQPQASSFQAAHSETVLSARAGPDGSQYVGYYESWRDPWTSSAPTSQIANLPPYVTQVLLSFFNPAGSYSGGVTFTGTGLDFSSDPQVVKDSISILKSKNPRTKVLLSVGGATYSDWTNLNAAQVANFVATFGLDGVDIDFEPQGAACRSTNGQISCATDDLYIRCVQQLRDALPADKMLTAAVWSIGAYGEPPYENAQPQGGYTGVSINMLKAVGTSLDSINIMAYDAGPAYQPKLAYEAYAKYYQGPMQLGMQVPPESWGGHSLTMLEVADLSMYVKDSGGSGMMLWALTKAGSPSAQEVSREVCLIFQLENCAAPLFPDSPSPPSSSPPPSGPVDPPPAPVEPPTSPVPSPSPSPFPMPSPPPNNPLCIYGASVTFRTTSCASNKNKFLAYSLRDCKDTSVLLAKKMGTTLSSRFSLGESGLEMTNVPLIARRRSSKCRTKYVKYGTKGPYLSARSAMASQWRIVPVDGRCDRVKLFVASVGTFKFVAVDETCSKTSLTPRSSGKAAIFKVRST